MDLAKRARERALQALELSGIILVHLTASDLKLLRYNFFDGDEVDPEDETYTRPTAAEARRFERDRVRFDALEALMRHVVEQAPALCQTADSPPWQTFVKQAILSQIDMPGDVVPFNIPIPSDRHLYVALTRRNRDIQFAGIAIAQPFSLHTELDGQRRGIAITAPLADDCLELKLICAQPGVGRIVAGYVIATQATRTSRGHQRYRHVAIEGNALNNRREMTAAALRARFNIYPTATALGLTLDAAQDNRRLFTATMATVVDRILDDTAYQVAGEPLELICPSQGRGQCLR